MWVQNRKKIQTILLIPSYLNTYIWIFKLDFATIKVAHLSNLLTHKYKSNENDCPRDKIVKKLIIFLVLQERTILFVGMPTFLQIKLHLVSEACKKTLIWFISWEHILNFKLFGIGCQKNNFYYVISSN